MDDVKVGGIVYPIEIKEDFTGDTSRLYFWLYFILILTVYVICSDSECF